MVTTPPTAELPLDMELGAKLIAAALQHFLWSCGAGETNRRRSVPGCRARFLWKRQYRNMEDMESWSNLATIMVDTKLDAEGDMEATRSCVSGRRPVSSSLSHAEKSTAAPMARLSTTASGAAFSVMQNKNPPSRTMLRAQARFATRWAISWRPSPPNHMNSE